MKPYKRLTVFIVTTALIVTLLYYYQSSLTSFLNETFSHESKKENNETLAEGILVVTAFINLGDFQKGDGVRTVPQYFDWAKIWVKLKNYVVCFTDDEKFYFWFQQIRTNLSTLLVKINRSQIDSFRRINEIKAIFSQPDYPKFNPDTTYAEYIATMNAKYDFVQMALEKTSQSFSHTMWLDIGLFREYPEDEQCFRLMLPKNFNSTLIAYNKVGDFIANISALDVIQRHHVWVNGGIFVGKTKKILQFINQFKKAVNRLIEMKSISTDQQTLMSIYSDKNFSDIKKIYLQTYEHDPSVPLNNNCWFSLGYIMRYPVNCTSPSDVDVDE